MILLPPIRNDSVERDRVYCRIAAETGFDPALIPQWRETLRTILTEEEVKALFTESVRNLNRD